METAKRENVLTGLVGAFLGSLVGVALIVLLGQMGYVASLSGLVMALCAMKGYSWLGGAMSKKGAVIVSLLTLVMTYFGNRLDFAVSVALAAEVDVFTAFRSIDRLLEGGYINAAAYWGGLAMLYLFTLLGAVPTLIRAFQGNLPQDTAPRTLNGVLPQGTQAQVPPAAAVEKKKSGSVILAFLPFVGMFLGFAVLWFSVSPLLLNGLVGGAQSPKALLQGYCSWYQLILAAVVLAVLLPAVGSVIALIKGTRSLGAILLVIISIAFPLFIGVAMVGMEQVPSLLSQAKADLTQLEQGSLQQTTVWLSPKDHSARLPGPYSSGQPEPCAEYRGFGDEFRGMFVYFYVPDCLGFSPDEDTLYNNEESIQWNEKNAQQYRLLYTSNFHLVASARPVGSMDGTGA